MPGLRSEGVAGGGAAEVDPLLVLAEYVLAEFVLAEYAEFVAEEGREGHLLRCRG